jgi:hypothetical protein
MYKCKKMYPFNFKGYFVGTVCYEFLYVFNLPLQHVVFSVHLTEDEGCREPALFGVLPS